MLWISIVFTFCLLESWSRGQSECANIFHSKTKSLAIVLVLQRYSTVKPPNSGHPK